MLLKTITEPPPSPGRQRPALPARAVWRFLRRHRLELLLVTPLVAYVVGLTFLPVLESIRLSFVDRYSGLWTLDNYRYLFGHGQFKAALRNTLVVTGIGLALELAVGLFIALVLSRQFRLRGLLRSIFLVPLGVPTLVSGVTFSYLFSTNGYLNALLYRAGLIDIPIDWTSGGLRTLWMIVVSDMWKVTPLVILLLLAGVESIPEEVYEAASVDGASTWQVFRNVTWPLLQPSVTIALILRGIDALRIFELPLVLAGRNTPFLATYAYTEYNVYFNPYTSGAAAAFLLVLIAVFVFGYLRLTRRFEEAGR